MNKHLIMIIRVSHRLQIAEKLQHVLSQYGCGINTRLGLHEAGQDDACANDGLIILHLVPAAIDCDAFAEDLNGVDGIMARLVEI